MNCFGQAHLEGLISFVVFLSVIGFFTSLEAEINSQSMSAAGFLSAKNSSQACAVIINSISANSLSRVSVSPQNCFPGNGTVSGKVGKRSVETVVFAGKVSLSANGLGGHLLEVKTLGHYK